MTIQEIKERRKNDRRFSDLTYPTETKSRNRNSFKKVSEIDRDKYKEYLKSDAWRKFRAKALNALGEYCSECKITEGLEVHHKHYRTLFFERIEDVQILCCKCHKARHKNIKKKRTLKNGKVSKYMRNPDADKRTATFYPNRTKK